MSLNYGHTLGHALEGVRLAGEDASCSPPGSATARRLASALCSR